jgi:D-xylose transport system ATP-binding protein
MERESILQIIDVHKHFGGTYAARGISFELHPGEVLALAGDNGAGKSTVIKMISGVYTPDAGQVLFNGESIEGRNPKEVRELGIETIYQDLALADNLDVGVNLFLGRERMTKAFGFLPVLDRPWMREEARTALKGLGIEINDLSMPVRDLSGGQRQAIAISRAVYWKAKVLIMDEPTAALGVPEQREVMDLIRRLKDQGVAIILISHNLNDIFAISDRIVVLERGRKAGERIASETDGNEIVRLMMGGKEVVR